MGTIGKAIHFSIDLALLSGMLAGIRRSTGLTPKLDSLDGQPQIKTAAQKYLNFGEWLVDSTAMSMSSSEHFVRK